MATSTEEQAIDKLLTDAEGVYDAGKEYEEYSGELVAPLTEEQKQGMYELINSDALDKEQAALGQVGQDTIYGIGQSQQMAQGVYDTDIGAATDKLYSQYYNQDLLDQQTSSMKQDMYEDYYRNQTQSEWNDVATGGSGSSRAGVAESVAYDEMNENMLAAQTNLQSNMYNTALGTASQQQQSQMQAQLGASQQMLAAGQSGMAAYGQASQASQQSMYNQLMAGGMQQQQNQAQNMADYGQWQASQNNAWDNINKYADVVYGAPREQEQQKSDSSGAWISAAATVAASFFSDINLKENIIVKKIVKGIDWVTWDWNKTAQEELGLTGGSEGVIAQDIQDILPEAVSRQENGYLAVNYDMVKAFMESE